MKHYLVIGGTGMLQAAVLGWNQEGHEVTVVARTEEKLRRLSESAAHPELLRTIQADYHQLENFQKQLETIPKPDIIVSWIHRSGNNAIQALCNLYGELVKRVALFHIKGSSAYNPRQNYTPRYTGTIQYHEVILGFQLNESTSRWLTNEEIANGVREAVKLQQHRYIVGIVEPWSSRPKS
ncbi:Rossmann-fold NAD(P)-binding domain-containing protein [Terribacillus saccharophilus]|uniref:hypothetical protein n=1 Tax=Terribacillus saccharophilus TaxID=361277 RepID=UPI00298A0277|nr:hypothetical protein [Terribacillus saccharophilus]MCM3226195.1 hypothetical protein [Terribacillus saccharophilus]